ncbi:hypothetical protein GF413_00440 [Candidatus Micrarchaeota archaeon]|nr:hypothetical protein [Candidatus Micrarchaeota archaeon]
MIIAIEFSVYGQMSFDAMQKSFDRRIQRNLGSTPEPEPETQQPIIIRQEIPQAQRKGSGGQGGAEGSPVAKPQLDLKAQGKIQAIADYEKEIAEKEVEIANNKKKIKKIESDLKNPKEDLEAAERKKLKNRITGLENENKQLKNEIQNIRDLIEKIAE